MAADAAGRTAVNPALHWCTATALGAAIAARRLSPVTLMQELLARIARLDPDHAVFVRLDAEQALAAARQAEDAAMHGRLLGPLHGIPVGVKDIIDVAGLPTTCHSKIRLDAMATRDAGAVARLRQQGAIVIGKLATHEFALGGPSFDLPFPPARNPWNQAHHPGGSSSGSGAGLAAGMFPLALGTDTAGSIRNPASCCGVVGLKPTYGAVSRRGVFPLAFTLDHVGPMARSVADVALLLDAIAGPDDEDAGSIRRPTRPASRDLGRGVRGLRIGYVRHFHEIDMPADPAVAQALDEAARLLAAEGATIVDVRLPDLNLFSAVARTILHSEAWSVHAEWLRTRPQDYARNTRQRLLVGAFIPAGDYLLAQRHRTRLIAAMQDIFRDVDVLLCASAMDPPCRIDDEQATARSYPRQARTPFNVTGHPALAMMAGLSPDGLPVAVQFAGRYNDEATLLRTASAFERAGGWQDRHPLP
jgi:aspartyl-tRNA(Asn)/glutamyl-tRNA(Gln) amidotransferase subunit A